MKSWKKTVTVLLITILIVVISFLTWTNGNYYSQFVQQTQAVMENSLNLWVSTTEMRLYTINEHINEILLTIYNNNSVTPGSPILSFESRRECQKTIEEKMQISSDADCFYIFDIESDWFLFTANSGIGNSRIAPMKQFVKENARNYMTSLNETSWYVANVGTESFFIKSEQVGKYLVGSMCSIKTFDLSNNLDVLRDDGSCLIISDNNSYYADGKYDWSADLKFNDYGQPSLGSGRSAITAAFPVIDGSVIVAYESASFGELLGRSTVVIIFVCSLICVGLIIILVITLHRKVLLPMDVLLNAQREISKGNINYRITETPGSSEFKILFVSFNNMAEQIQDLRIQSYDRLLEVQNYRLKMVRAQIKPHFYLNAITTMYNMTYQNRLKDIRTFIKALAKYMRYMMNIQSSWVTIAEEIGNVKTYLEMQELRFPGSVQMKVECTEDAESAYIPFLTLFTLVENAIKHAMNLYHPLDLLIRCEFWTEEGFSGYRITVDDNGDGFPEEVLEEYKNAALGDVLPPKEHLGLSNIRYTLQFMYQRQDLLRLSNHEGGARAEILIPKGASLI